MDSDLPAANERLRLGDPYAELFPVSIVFLVLLSAWYLLYDFGDFPLSPRFWGQVAWSTLIIVTYPIMRRWMLSPRRWYAELTDTELIVRQLGVTLTAAYANIRRVSRHDPGWRRALARFRALFGRPELPACMQVELRAPIRRTLFLKSRRLLLRPQETALFLQTLQERAPAAAVSA